MDLGFSSACVYIAGTNLSSDSILVHCGGLSNYYFFTDKIIDLMVETVSEPLSA